MVGLVKCGRLLFDLLFPKICAVCGRTLLYHEQHFCLECFADIPFTHFWNVQDNPAEKVFWGRCRVERVYSLFYYTNNYRGPIHMLKYDGHTPIGKFLGKMLGKKLLLPDNFIHCSLNCSNFICRRLLHKQIVTFALFPLYMGIPGTWASEHFYHCGIKDVFSRMHRRVFLFVVVVYLWCFHNCFFCPKIAKKG